MFNSHLAAMLTVTVTVFLLMEGARGGDRLPIPGTPGFEVKLEGEAREGLDRTLALLIPQKSFPAGAGKVCISTKDGEVCSTQMGPYGQQWDAPRAFRFSEGAVKDVPAGGSISIFSEAGERLATFGADLDCIGRLLRD